MPKARATCNSRVVRLTADGSAIVFLIEEATSDGGRCRPHRKGERTNQAARILAAGGNRVDFFFGVVARESEGSPPGTVNSISPISRSFPSTAECSATWLVRPPPVHRRAPGLS